MNLFIFDLYIKTEISQKGFPTKMNWGAAMETIEKRGRDV